MSANARPATRPTIAPPVAPSSPLDDAAVTSARAEAQLNREAANVADARARLVENQEQVAADARRKAAANAAFDENQKFHDSLASATPAARPTIILDANTLREQRIAQSKQIAKDLQMDTTVPGGYYIVNGKAVDANGKPIAEPTPEPVAPTAPPVQNTPNQGTPPDGSQSGAATGGTPSATGDTPTPPAS